MLDVKASLPSCVVPGKSFWGVADTDDWENDVERGRRLAGEVATYLHNDGSPMILQRIVDDMRGEVSGVSVGFFTEIAARVTTEQTSEPLQYAA